MRHHSLHNVSVISAFASGPTPSADYTDYFVGHLSTCSAANGNRELSDGYWLLGMPVAGSGAESSC